MASGQEERRTSEGWRTGGPEGPIVDRLIGWPVGKGEANERGLEDARAGGHEGGRETIRVRGRERRGRETAGNGVRHHHRCAR